MCIRLKENGLNIKVCHGFDLTFAALQPCRMFFMTTGDRVPGWLAGWLTKLSMYNDHGFTFALRDFSTSGAFSVKWDVSCGACAYKCRNR